MEFDDYKIASLDEYENMAKAYSASMKNKGFIFVKLEDEEEKFLIGEIFDLLNKITISIDAMSCICDAKEIKCATEKHIELLKSMFNYGRPNQFEIKEKDLTKVFLGLISLENTLTMKLFMLAMRNKNLENLLDIIFERLKIYSKSFDVSSFKLLSIQ